MPYGEVTRRFIRKLLSKAYNLLGITGACMREATGRASEANKDKADKASGSDGQPVD